MVTPKWFYVCSEQCNSSIATKFHVRADYYKSRHRNFQKKYQTEQVTRNILSTLSSNFHIRIYDWDITIDHVNTGKSLWQCELYLYYKLKTYTPFDLNECDV